MRRSIPKLLSSVPNTSAVVFDNLSAFYWMDRVDQPTAEMQTRLMDAAFASLEKTVSRPRTRAWDAVLTSPVEICRCLPAWQSEVLPHIGARQRLHNMRKQGTLCHEGRREGAGHSAAEGARQIALLSHGVAAVTRGH